MQKKTVIDTKENSSSEAGSKLLTTMRIQRPIHQLITVTLVNKARKETDVLNTHLSSPVTGPLSRVVSTMRLTVGLRSVQSITAANS